MPSRMGVSRLIASFVEFNILLTTSMLMPDSTDISSGVGFLSVVLESLETVL